MPRQRRPGERRDLADVIGRRPLDDFGADQVQATQATHDLQCLGGVQAADYPWLRFVSA